MLPFGTPRGPLDDRREDVASLLADPNYWIVIPAAEPISEEKLLAVDAQIDRLMEQLDTKPDWLDPNGQVMTDSITEPNQAAGLLELKKATPEALRRGYAWRYAFTLGNDHDGFHHYVEIGRRLYERTHRGEAVAIDRAVINREVTESEAQQLLSGLTAVEAG